VNTLARKPRYAVIGNPVEHSRSPFIHEQFARQLGIALYYDKITATPDNFAAVVDAFFAEGGKGLNVTVPFKVAAYALAKPRLSERARSAGAVNTLWVDQGCLHGCNTDGIGLLTDLQRLGATPDGKKILLVGAGGAAKGVVFPLLEAQCAHLRIVNRTESRAIDLQTQITARAAEFSTRLSAGRLNQVDGRWDLVINATSSSLSGLPPDLPNGIFAPGSLAYDMMYAAQPTSFMRQALKQGAGQVSDGLGMLVGQAAASFAIWHNVAPDPAPVLTALRRQLLAS